LWTSEIHDEALYELFRMVLQLKTWYWDETYSRGSGWCWHCVEVSADTDSIQCHCNTHSSSRQHIGNMSPRKSIAFSYVLYYSV